MRRSLRTTNISEHEYLVPICAATAENCSAFCGLDVAELREETFITDPKDIDHQRVCAMEVEH